MLAENIGMHKQAALAALFISFALIVAQNTNAAGLPKMGPPIPTTVVLTKPAPGEIYGNKQTVTFGVGDKAYKFVLKDADTNSLRVKWPDIWEYVEQFNPNFVVQGRDAETFTKIQPGQTVTINGMFAPMDRTFEVMNVQQNTPEQHY
jgi:hypothetical protein